MSARFRLLLADPPWRFKDKLPGPNRGAAKHYKTLTVADLKAYPLPPLFDDALLLLWRVAAMGEEAYAVARAWGFIPKAEIVWIKRTQKGKRHIGMGRYTRGEHEICLVCARGKAHTLVRDHGIRSTFEAPVGPHSAKPDAFYALAERLFSGPRVELFARRPRDHWTSYGLELPGGDAHP